ncbi:MAG: hypothetical protein UY11_C0042G0007 [Candidatus Amesbacteria bacterium GW2011_GWC2_47_8]|uniref:Uncharacterized protein n=1 Tax=Candidatus Amesbacteria bacterium GW2011_GWC2_47_8 TaxID=1618367 RepID=A0A0G1TLI0_9BACT|nr:MAG: hypothetical protein UY11_C0042G0007 [Candidatus Amesbacteria bacterium GW2011_GWC2_47_8]
MTVDWGPLIRRHVDNASGNVTVVCPECAKDNPKNYPQRVIGTIVQVLCRYHARHLIVEVTKTNDHS